MDGIVLLNLKNIKILYYILDKKYIIIYIILGYYWWFITRIWFDYGFFNWDIYRWEMFEVILIVDLCVNLLTYYKYIIIDSIKFLKSKSVLQISALL